MQKSPRQKENGSCRGFTWRIMGNIRACFASLHL